MIEHVADRLCEAIDATAAPVCVGIDPVRDRLPAGAPALTAIGDFTLGILDAVAGEVPCVKLQSACFERFGHEGVRLLEAMTDAAAERGLVGILDAKRGDIGLSAAHYAAAVFEPAAGGRPADWVTVNAYLGDDGVRPFLGDGRGAFALVRTSNPGGDAIQGRALVDGGTVADAVATVVAGVGEAFIGTSGYSALGAVVGATKPDDIERLRSLMPRQIFLVPGYGAQGGSADDVRACFDTRGRGAVITASRSVIYAADPGTPAWRTAVTDAARRLADEIGCVAGLR